MKLIIKESLPQTDSALSGDGHLIAIYTSLLTNIISSGSRKHKGMRY